MGHRDPSYRIVLKVVEQRHKLKVERKVVERHKLKVERMDCT